MFRTHTHSDELSGIFSPFSIFIFFVLAYTNTFSKIHRYTHMYRFKIFLLLRNNFHFGGIFRRKKLSFLLFENSLQTTQLFHFFYTHTLTRTFGVQIHIHKKDLCRRRLILFGYFSLSNFAFTEDNLTTQIP